MRYDETVAKADYRCAAPAYAPTEPSLLNTASEALKYLSEVNMNLVALERNLFDYSPKPEVAAKDLEQPNTLESKLRLFSAQAANLAGFTATLLNKIS